MLVDGQEISIAGINVVLLANVQLLAVPEGFLLASKVSPELFHPQGWIFWDTGGELL